MALLQWNRQYQVKAAKIAAFDADAETWGTPVTIQNLQAFSMTPVVDNDTMSVYGVNEHFLAVLKGVELSLDFGGVQRNVAAIMTGFTASSSGSGDNEQRTTRNEGGANMPYFGLAVQIKDDKGGDVHVYFPRLKARMPHSLQLNAESQFVVPNITCDGGRLTKSDDSQYPIYDEIEHATETALPTDFNTDFEALS
jgi:hypothetical protein